MISKSEIETLAVQLATPFLDVGPLLQNLDEADLEPVLDRVREIRPELRPNHEMIRVIQQWKARQPEKPI
jgi:hypothetical protein